VEAGLNGSGGPVDQSSRSPGLNGADRSTSAFCSMARRLCRLPRLFPLVSSASASAAPRPHHLPFAVNPNPAPLAPSFSSSSPPAFPGPHRLFSSTSIPLDDSILLSSRPCPPLHFVRLSGTYGFLGWLFQVVQAWWSWAPRTPSTASFPRCKVRRRFPPLPFPNHARC
jgi:hypothetical protein